MFISFEGIDGCGKSTQLALAAEALSQQLPQDQLLVTKNPGGTELGLALRQLLLNPNQGPMDPTCELLLYMADRAQHVGTVLRPHLAQGGWVLCDRFHDSTLAYQGYGRGLALETITTLNQVAAQGCLPSLTFVLDGPVDVLAQRVNKRGQLDRLEQEGLAFAQRVREGFLALAQAEPQRIIVLDATASIEALHQQVMNHLEPHVKAS